MAEAEELQDWEMLSNPETALIDSSLTAIQGGDSQNLIRPDYFTLLSDPNKRASGVDSISAPSSKSDHTISSSISLPSSDTEVLLSPKSVEYERKQELGHGEDSKQLDIQGTELGSKGSEDIGDLGGNHEVGCEEYSEKDVGFVEISEVNEIDRKASDNSGGILLESSGDVSEMENFKAQLACDNLEHTANDGISERSESSVGNEIGGGVVGELTPRDNGKRGAIWWKLPIELLKFCVFRISPVWTCSIAAAIMGLIILRRRLSRMSCKSRSIPIRLAVEDKKVPQFSEAFSVVRRVPIIRPLLPAAGVTPWPVLNLR